MKGLLMATCLFLSFEKVIPQSRPVRKFLTLRYLEIQKQLDVSLAHRRADIETFIHNNQNNLKTWTSNIELYLIFHVLYNSADERISEEQIFSQIDALNHHFGSPANTTDQATLEKGSHNSLIGHSEISFCLAHNGLHKLDQNGLNYIKTDRLSWPFGDQMKSSKGGGRAPIAPSYYINIWVVNMDEEISGYAQMPGGAIATDGIVIDYRFMGIGNSNCSLYNEGKTLTHLMGNYLNLYPLWGMGLCEDDWVEDTPIHNGPNYGCPILYEMSTCYREARIEMTTNFMDNTDDACMTMFTKGQINRMYASLIKGGSRHGLLNASLRYNEDGIAAEDQRVSEFENCQIIICTNPNLDKVYLQFFNLRFRQRVDLAVYDRYKQLISEKVFVIGNFDEHTLDIEMWESGLYFMQFRTESSLISTSKFVLF